MVNRSRYLGSREYGVAGFVLSITLATSVPGKCVKIGFKTAKNLGLGGFVGVCGVQSGCRSSINGSSGLGDVAGAGRNEHCDDSESTAHGIAFYLPSVFRQQILAVFFRPVTPTNEGAGGECPCGPSHRNCQTAPASPRALHGSSSRTQRLGFSPLSQTCLMS